MKKRVAIYARVSTKEQNCERQLVELREYAEKNDMEVVSEYVDTGFSGTKKSRPQLDVMMKDARQRKFMTILCLELSRIARSSKNLLDIVDDLKGRNQHLHIVNQGISTENVMGEFFCTVISAISQIEVENTKERVISGIANKRKNNGGNWGRKSNLSPTIEKKIREMKSKNIGLKKIATECSVGVKTVRTVLTA